MAMNKQQQRDIDKLVVLLKTYTLKLEKYRKSISDARRKNSSEFLPHSSFTDVNRLIETSLRKSLPKFEKLAGTASEYIDHVELSSMDSLELELTLMDFELELKIVQELVDI